MVRSTHFMHIIEKREPGRERARDGRTYLKSLQTIAAEFPIMTAVRGRGLFIAFDLPDPKTRDEFWKGLFDTAFLPSNPANRRSVFVPRSTSVPKRSTKRWSCCANNVSACSARLVGRDGSLRQRKYGKHSQQARSLRRK